MILDTRNFQDSMEALMENIRAKFVEAGAAVIAMTNKGQLKFRRVTDRKFPAGMYLQIAFEASARVPGLIRSKFSLDSTVNRVFIECK